MVARDGGRAKGTRGVAVPRRAANVVMLVEETPTLRPEKTMSNVPLTFARGL